MDTSPLAQAATKMLDIYSIHTVYIRNVPLTNNLIRNVANKNGYFRRLVFGSLKLTI